MHETNIGRLDLNLLVVFDAVAQARSVTAAAERLALSQPAVSHALNRLRAIVNDPLFVRGKGGLTLTPFAVEMSSSVERALAAARDAFVQQKFDPRTSQRRFRIGASDYANVAIVPRFARDIKKASPKSIAEFWLVGATTLAQLETGDLDCAFWGAPVPEPPWFGQQLYKERLVGAVAKTHPLAAISKKRRISLDEFTAYPHVMVAVRDTKPSTLDQALARVGRSRRVTVATQSFSANIALLHDSDLVASLPSRLLSPAQRKEVCAFELPVALPEYGYSLIWHRRTHTDPAHVWLRQLAARMVR